MILTLKNTVKMSLFRGEATSWDPCTRISPALHLIPTSGEQMQWEAAAEDSARWALPPTWETTLSL